MIDVVPVGKRPPSVERRVDVYLPTIERRDEWHAAAAKRGVKLSAMVYHIVELHLAEEADAALRAPVATRGEVEALRDELARARVRLEEVESHAARLQREVDHHRARALAGDPARIALDSRLIRALSEARTLEGKPRAVSTTELHQALGIGMQDELVLQGFSAQMDQLQLHGLVRITSKGWVWRE